MSANYSLCDGVCEEELYQMSVLAYIPLGCSLYTFLVYRSVKQIMLVCCWYVKPLKSKIYPLFSLPASDGNLNLCFIRVIDPGSYD